MYGHKQRVAIEKGVVREKREREGERDRARQSTGVPIVAGSRLMFVNILATTLHAC